MFEVWKKKRCKKYIGKTNRYNWWLIDTCTNFHLYNESKKLKFFGLKFVFYSWEVDKFCWAMLSGHAKETWCNLGALATVSGAISCPALVLSLKVLRWQLAAQGK